MPHNSRWTMRQSRSNCCASPHLWFSSCYGGQRRKQLSTLQKRKVRLCTALYDGRLTTLPPGAFGTTSGSAATSFEVTCESRVPRRKRCVRLLSRYDLRSAVPQQHRPRPCIFKLCPCAKSFVSPKALCLESRACECAQNDTVCAVFSCRVLKISFRHVQTSL